MSRTYRCSSRSRPCHCRLRLDQVVWWLLLVGSRGRILPGSTCSRLLSPLVLLLNPRLFEQSVPAVDIVALTCIGEVVTGALMLMPSLLVFVDLPCLKTASTRPHWYDVRRTLPPLRQVMLSCHHFLHSISRSSSTCRVVASQLALAVLLIAVI